MSGEYTSICTNYFYFFKSSILLYLEHKISFIISCFILKLYVILKNTTLYPDPSLLLHLLQYGYFVHVNSHL